MHVCVMFSHVQHLNMDKDTAMTCPSASPFRCGVNVVPCLVMFGLTENTQNPSSRSVGQEPYDKRNLFSRQHQSANENSHFGFRSSFCSSSDRKSVRDEMLLFLFSWVWWTEAVRGAWLKKPKGHQLQAVGSSVVMQTIPNI